MDKLTGAKLHNGVFLAGINLGQTLGTAPGAKQVALSMEGQYLRVEKAGKAILVPFTNIAQIDIEVVPNAPAAK